MRHIALITTSFPSGADGSEAAGSFVADFSQELAKHVAVTVLAPGRAGKHRNLGKLAVREYDAPLQPLSLLKVHNPLHWPAILRTLRSGTRELESLLAESRPDHVFALWALPSGYWAMKAGRRLGVPYSIWALGSDIWSLKRIPLVSSLLKKVLRQSLLNFADGYGLCSDVEQICGRPCTFLPSTRRMEARPASRDDGRGHGMRLAFLGRWHPNKGPDLLLEALALLDDDTWERIEEVRFCGGGPLEDEIRAQVTDLVQAGRPVTLAGYLGKPEAADLFQWADYVLIPSRRESIPVVFSDAMQAGKPVLANPVGDLPRLTGEFGCGLVADEASAPAYAALVTTAVVLPRDHFHAGIEKAAQAFDLEYIAGDLLERLT